MSQLTTEEQNIKKVTFDMNVKEHFVPKQKNKSIKLSPQIIFKRFQKQELKNQRIKKQELKKEDPPKENLKKKNQRIKKQELKKEDPPKENLKKKKHELKKGDTIKLNIEFKDLTELEKEILEKGTFKDKIDLITLITLKTGNSEYFEVLLSNCLTCRNDNKVYILSNIKDLLIENFLLNSLNKIKLKKIFELETKNNYIKEKVINVLEKIVKKGILLDDLLYIYINKLGDKRELSSKILLNLKKIYQINKNVVLKELLYFYEKYEDLRGKVNVLIFLNENCREEDLDCFLKDVFNSLELKNDTLSLKMYNLILQLIQFREIKGLNFKVLKMLYRRKEHTPLCLSIIYTNFPDKLPQILINSLENIDFLEIYAKQVFNFIKESFEDKKNIIKKLFKSPAIKNLKYLVGLINLAKEFEVDFEFLDVYKEHYHPIVQNLFVEKSEVFDVFDGTFEERIVESIKD